MQLSTVYKSAKRADTYLFIEKANDFSRVPETLLEMFGKGILVMTLDLDGREKLGQADLSKVKAELLENGFYLQLPPPTENMLDELKKQNGVQD